MLKALEKSKNMIFSYPSMSGLGRNADPNVVQKPGRQIKIGTKSKFYKHESCYLQSTTTAWAGKVKQKKRENLNKPGRLRRHGGQPRGIQNWQTRLGTKLSEPR